jgi:uncharacterized repeat protein (TIGR04076 family)
LRPDRQEVLGPCELFQEGQEFVTDVFKNMPQGFCPWAWNDIYKNLVVLGVGVGSELLYKEPNVVVACCSDGLRPVVFKLERLAAED